MSLRIGESRSSRHFRVSPLFIPAQRFSSRFYSAAGGGGFKKEEEDKGVGRVLCLQIGSPFCFSVSQRSHSHSEARRKRGLEE